MSVYEGTVRFEFPYVIEADDEEHAEFVMIAAAKDDFPEGDRFEIVNIRKIN